MKKEENRAAVSGHTPGPWKVVIGMDALVVFPNGAHCNVGDTIYHPENEANARLIAAAPEMLEALEIITHHPNFNGCIDPIGSNGIDARKLAEAAIQKARGGK